MEKVRYCYNYVRGEASVRFKDLSKKENEIALIEEVTPEHKEFLMY
jgi:hypothetical protein